MKITSVSCVEIGEIYTYLIVVVVDLVGTKSNDTALNTGLKAHSNSATTTTPQGEKGTLDYRRIHAHIQTTYHFPPPHELQPIPTFSFS